MVDVAARGGGGVSFSPPEWQALLRTRVGVPVVTAGGTCPLCQDPDDEWGDHRLCCAQCGLYRRHNRVRDFLAGQCTAAGCAVEVEPTRLSDKGKRPDLAVRGFSEGANAEEAWDVTVSHPLRQSAAPAAPVTPGHSASDAEGLKAGNGVASFCRGAGVSFRPMEWETTGAVGRNAAAGVKLLGRKMSLMSEEGHAHIMARLWTGISVILAKGCPEMLTRAA